MLLKSLIKYHSLGMNTVGGADNMANIFKDYYELNCTVLLANIIKEVWPEFNENGFVVILKNELAEKEFL